MRTELVVKAQAGDRDAFSMIAASVSPRLYASARFILHQPDDAEDAVQDALIEAWRDIRGLRDPDRLDAWLHRLLVRACSRRARRDQRRRVTELHLDGIDLAQPGDAPGAVADRDEMARAFRRLTVDQRAILALVYYADLPLADVGLALGIPVGTTKSRLNRAMAALRAALAADERAIRLTDGQPA